MAHVCLDPLHLHLWFHPFIHFLIEKWGQMTGGIWLTLQQLGILKVYRNISAQAIYQVLCRILLEEEFGRQFQVELFQTCVSRICKQSFSDRERLEGIRIGIIRNTRGQLMLEGVGSHIDIKIGWRHFLALKTQITFFLSAQKLSSKTSVWPYRAYTDPCPSGIMPNTEERI